MDAVLPLPRSPRYPAADERDEPIERLAVYLRGAHRRAVEGAFSLDESRYPLDAAHDADSIAPYIHAAPCRDYPEED